jgi:hypothetical protein
MQVTVNESSLLDMMKSTLEGGKSFRFRARGFSMGPFIKDGDVVTIAPIHGRLPGLGDIVATVNGAAGRLFIHRVTRKNNNEYVTRGDNGESDDIPVSAKQILGCVTCVERGGKKVRLGLGPERHAMGLLSGKGLLAPLIASVNNILKSFKK